MKLLWLARTIPLPLTSGDRIYTARLAESVGRAVASLRFVGLDAADDGHTGRLSADVDWQAIPGGPDPQVGFLRSATLPMAAVRHGTSSYRQTVHRTLATETWDGIILDQYSMVWCLDLIRTAGFRGPLVHVSHDFETDVTHDLARAFRGNIVKKLLLMENSRRAAMAEQRLAQACAVITAITDEDRRRFEQLGTAAECVTVSPGYKGKGRAHRRMTADLPRRVIVVGSYDWMAKQLNLTNFLKVADARLAAAGIELRVVGSIPEKLRAEIAETTRATRLMGFVDDLASEFDRARMALVFEETGGGFKLKILDYIFNRVPVFGLAQALVGLPTSVASSLRTATSIVGLVDRIVTGIDDVESLDYMQQNAYAAASDLFDWNDAGRVLSAAVERARTRAMA